MSLTRNSNMEGIGNDSFTNGLRAEDILMLRECLHHVSSDIDLHQVGGDFSFEGYQQHSQSSFPQCQDRNKILALLFDTKQLGKKVTSANMIMW